ncbi:ATP-binding cassette domain-containing protein [candidate division KSB1 bacterium]|nr:ATP-binding cassette domain-containing protein [candidate division KSB1 bacterium]
MKIVLRGAGEHNLKGIDVEFGDGLTVITGVSGSGKTSLVFDTLYHEARRRFLDIYAFGSPAQRLLPAKVHSITGLGPAISIGQNLLNRNPNSTLATASGLHPFLRLLYANFGERRCPGCGAVLTVFSKDEIIDRLRALSEDSAIAIFVPLMQAVQGSHRTLLNYLLEEFPSSALLVDGYPFSSIDLSPEKAHTIEINFGEISASNAVQEIRQTVEAASSLGAFSLVARGNETDIKLSWALVCGECGTWFSDIEPLHFHMRCTDCQGAGCKRCDETGLHPEAAAVRWQQLRFTALLAKSIDELQPIFTKAYLPGTANRLRSEILKRLDALKEVGLGYIALNRPVPTLSRGEAQRLRLAVALTGRLEDMLHILDEPTIGQHPANVNQLVAAFRKLAGPVIFVEHDRIAAAAADHAIDIGPGAGHQGGRLVFSGSPVQLWEQDSPTGKLFSLREQVHVPAQRHPVKRFLTIRRAHLRNLKYIDVAFPASRLTVITGVSGSGKSTLVEGVLLPSFSKKQPVFCDAIEGHLLKPLIVDQQPIGRNPRSNPATYTKLSDIIRDLFASRTGLTASYFSFNRPEGACPVCKGLGALEIKMRYLPSTWSTCADCGGRRYSDEVLSARIELDGRKLSIADVYESSIAEFHSIMQTDRFISKPQREAALRILEALCDVGLGYLLLGQPSITLSGGEAQRVKLARTLGRRSLAQNLIVLDEPSTGLHPYDIAGLLIVLDRLVRAGATIVVVEHNTDIIRAADWIIDLGPGAGEAGGQVLYSGSVTGLLECKNSLTAEALREEKTISPKFNQLQKQKTGSDCIEIRNARANNLKQVDVDFPKEKLTVVTGVSGSGKSSLVNDILESEARRRFFESLSLYERQNTREGPEAPVDSVKGLGVALTIGTRRNMHNLRSTVGIVTELSHHLAILFSFLGELNCLNCGTRMVREDQWRCSSCKATIRIAEPRHFLPASYGAACRKCHGVGSQQIPNPDKLIIHPELPLCKGAMHSPGFFPKGYLCKPFNGGYDLVQAVAVRYHFDPATTPWNQMSPEAQQAFLFGDPEPLEVIFRSKAGRSSTRTVRFPGFYGWIRDWDLGGTYTDTRICPECKGTRLRAEFAAVKLGATSIHQMSEMPLMQFRQKIEGIHIPDNATEFLAASLEILRKRVRFLCQVGLGYLHLNRLTSSLSAGEAQRIRLAGLLGSGLTSLTLLLDEPTRGLHPSEVQALLNSLKSLRDEGNTVIVVEHDLVIIRAADYIIDMGPGAGAAGGKIVARGSPPEVAATNTLTGRWLCGERQPAFPATRRTPKEWLRIEGARENNLKIDELALPLGIFVGICGVSGSGKSTLMIDTLGRVLSPKKQTTSVAYEPISPGRHASIEGAPERTIIIDQARKGIHSPADYLNLTEILKKLYLESEDAQALGLTAKALSRSCTACSGQGTLTIDMGFLPNVQSTCETCRGTGYLEEAWAVCLKDLSLPEIFSLTLDEVYELWKEHAAISRLSAIAREVGLGYLVLRQPGFALSGGEIQRLKIAKELCKTNSQPTLYLLDEPTVGLHTEDVAALVSVLQKLVDAGHSVMVIEHHPHVLAACDWLIELGSGGGPDGGRVVSTGTPESVAAGDSATAPYLREIFGCGE